MAEVLIQFTGELAGTDGRRFAARACGREREDGKWEAWIEFVPADGGTVLSTSRETTQPNRRDLDYWATGLSAAYLEGALSRAQQPSPRVEAEPTSEAPALEPADAGVRRPVQPRAVLDPFAVYRRSGESILRQELSALSVAHLRNIITEYDLASGVDEVREASTLAELIVAKVRLRAD